MRVFHSNNMVVRPGQTVVQLPSRRPSRVYPIAAVFAIVWNKNNNNNNIIFCYPRATHDCWLGSDTLVTWPESQSYGGVMFCLCVLIGDKMMYIIPNERLSSGRLVLAYVTISGVIITRSCLATRAVMIRVGFFPR